EDLAKPAFGKGIMSWWNTAGQKDSISVSRPWRPISFAVRCLSFTLRHRRQRSPPRRRPQPSPSYLLSGSTRSGRVSLASVNNPGGNATGMTLISVALGQKRLEILRDISPKASVIAMLVNPLSPDAIPEIGPVQAGAQQMGLQLAMFNAGTQGEFDTTFAA